MKKLFLVLIFVLTLSGCDLIGGLTPVVYDFELFDGQDTIEINTEWIDAGAVMYFDSTATGPNVFGTVDTTELGLYKIEYKSTNAGVEYIIERYVMVVDETQPVITLNPGLDTVNLGEEWIDAGAVVLDNSLEVLTYTVVDDVDINTVGRYTVTYTAVDSSGNETSINRIINIVE